MLAAVFRGPGRLAMEEVAVPGCPPGGVLLAVDACAVCGTDVRITTHGHAKVKPPQVLGHEVVGRVLASDTPTVPVGLRATLAPAVGCGACRWCAAGQPNRCPSLRTIGYHYPGAFAPLLAVPAEAVRQGSVVPVPADLPDAVACLTEPLACCLNGQDLAGLTAGDRVAIVGAGPIGLLHARLAAARGAAQVILVEQSERRREVARSLGCDPVIASGPTATAAIGDLTGGAGVDLVVVAAPSGQAQADGLAWLAPGGRLSCFGGLPPDHPPVALDTNLIHYRELTMVGAHGSSPAQNRTAAELLATGAVSAVGLVTAQFELAQTPTAVATMARGDGLKCVVAVGQSMNVVGP